MKTLKFMLAAATAIGLASATHAANGVDTYASTGFEKLAVGTSVTNGIIETGAVDSYFYYAGATPEDNESVIIAASDVADPLPATRPTGADTVDAGRANVLQVSTGTDPLMRTYAALNGTTPQGPTALEGTDVYVDTLVQFTVTPYTDTVTPSNGVDKLMIYLKETTNEVNDVIEYSTNLVVVGGYCVSDGEFEAKEYVVSRNPGEEILPNKWYRLTVKVIANYGELDGYQHPAFQVYLDGDLCVFDEYAVAEAGEGVESTTGFVVPFAAAEPGALGEKTVVFSLLCTGDQAASLQGVGFAGEGKVDDIVFSDVDPFFTAVDFTFAAVSGVEATRETGTDNWTFTAPEGTVIKSFLVNGNPVAAAVGATSYQWTAEAANAGALVIVSAGKQLTAAEHPWYESPKGFVLAENLPGQTGQIVSSFHGQGQDEYLGNTYATNPTQFDLFKVDGTNELTSVYNVPAADATTPGFRGVAISKALGIAMTLAYAKTTTMYAYPLDPSGDLEVIAVSKPSTHSFDAAAFSPDGKYLFSNALNGESSNQFYVKWSVTMTTNSLTLTEVGSIPAGGRGRNMAYARINGRDLVFAMADTGKVVAIDMTGDDTSAWAATDLITDLPKHSYGSLCVSGVNATGATPKLTVATSINNADGNSNTTDVLNVYTLTVPSSGAVSVALTKSFDQAAMTAAFFGDTTDANRYGNTVYVTDDNATIYFGRGDNKLYAGIYVPKHDITFVAGEDSTTLSVYEGDTPVAADPVAPAGKEFAGWSPDVAPATAAATYTATFDWITYTITYKNADDSAFTDFVDGYTAPATFTAETTVDLPVAANVDVSGTFNSWTNAAGTAVANTSGLYENLVVFANVSESTGWVDDVTKIPANTSVADQYSALADSVLATADAKEVTEWAATNNVAFADVAAATTGTTYSDAFLLNCAPNAAAVAAEKDDFVLTITFDASGNPVVNLPEGKKYNGKVQLKGKAALTDAEWTPVSEASSSYKFYMYELSL